MGSGVVEPMTQRSAEAEPVNQMLGECGAYPQRLEVPIGDRIVVLACYCVSGPAQACAIMTPPAGPSFIGKQVHWGPWVYKPNRSPQAPLGLL